MNIAPDTQQNFLYALYFLIRHNALPILYLCALTLSTIWALIRPTRAKILCMIGFSLLLFAFQYEKHIQEPLLTQTRNSLITERSSQRVDRAISLVVEDVAHRTFNAMGVISLISATFMLIQPKLLNRLHNGQIMKDAEKPAE